MLEQDDVATFEETQCPARDNSQAPDLTHYSVQDRLASFLKMRRSTHRVGGSEVIAGKLAGATAAGTSSPRDGAADAGTNATVPAEATRVSNRLAKDSTCKSRSFGQNIVYGEQSVKKMSGPRYTRLDHTAGITLCQIRRGTCRQGSGAVSDRTCKALHCPPITTVQQRPTNPRQRGVVASRSSIPHTWNSWFGADRVLRRARRGRIPDGHRSTGHVCN